MEEKERENLMKAIIAITLILLIILTLLLMFVVPAVSDERLKNLSIAFLNLIGLAILIVISPLLYMVRTKNFFSKVTPIILGLLGGIIIMISIIFSIIFGS